MFELVLLAMACTASALIIVWLWRKLAEFSGSTVDSLSGKKSRLKPNQRQEHASWKGMVRRKRAKRLPQDRVNAKPWGW